MCIVLSKLKLRLWTKRKNQSATALKKKKDITFDARVVWCKKAIHPGFYDSGIQLLNVPPKEIEVIEQFIEEATLEDRWLSIN